MNDTATPLLEAHNLTRGFQTEGGTVEVLKGVDLSLARGDMVALLGQSGAGKSTLIQILGTLDRPTTGSVRMTGVDLFKLSRSQLARWRNENIAFVYQQHRLLPEFSALENVMLPLLIRRMGQAPASKQAQQVLERVGLAHRQSHRPGQLSGGEQQRVAIARALVGGPKLLLADEPTGNLDTHTADGIFDLLLALNAEQQLTQLIVTHNPDLAARMGRRVRMQDGQIVDGDAP
ncbi:ABC transporter related protein [Magnetococcus marinus MC-1]|uniref:ABC transporter related protein n=1 Tax=Magnetococcus marinus (strain ATCC BAA-1437 / JCM 17883 / MC-1) TaxID=156889 RepID=A0L6F9_MAGMM|nr:ABC transporter ATP-binding protein [Magnetococcus marinus]ABK43552.1 ABC transporter related protein [Magnetococcus marinus MC-1]